MLAHDYLHNVLERPRQLSNYDLCLRQTDCDWHRPFIVRIHTLFMCETCARVVQIPRRTDSKQLGGDKKEPINQPTAETPADIIVRTMVHMLALQDHLIQVGMAEDINRRNGLICFYNSLLFRYDG